MTIQSINSTDEGLEIYWSNSNISCFPWFWLRDHSESFVDLHPDTKQRQIDSFSTPLDNTVNKVWLDENAQNVYVKWEDGEHRTITGSKIVTKIQKFEDFMYRKKESGFPLRFINH